MSRWVRDPQPGPGRRRVHPNAVVTLQKLSISAGKPAQILEAQTDRLTKKLNVTDEDRVYRSLRRHSDVEQLQGSGIEAEPEGFRRYRRGREKRLA